MVSLESLKTMIDEYNYPYFEDGFLINQLDRVDRDLSIEQLVRELCLVKSGIPEIKIGDINIPSPKEHFLLLAGNSRKNVSRVVRRADGQ